ncbi:MAG: AraC family transcriptional regulator, partial [Clostridiales bacterium]|nr:AraC family transcriptional regulator [Clostridiales bacterium]
MDTDDGIYIISADQQVCAPDYAFGPAVRDHYLIHFISTGRGQYEVGGKVFTLSAGEGFIIYPGA